MIRSEGTIEVESGIRLHYAAIGDGEPAVLVPVKCWLPVEFETLAKGRRLICYDPRGRGQSDPVADGSRLGIEQDVSDVDAIRRHFQLERVALIGWSIYGNVVARYAMNYPHHVSRVVLAAPGPIRRQPYDANALETRNASLARVNPAEIARLQQMQKAGAAGRDEVSYCRQFFRVFAAMRMGNPADVEKVNVEAVCSLQNEWPDRFAAWWAAIDRSLGNWDWRADASKVTAPVLVLQGDSDLSIPEEAGREWAALAPNARMVPLHGVGHHIWTEAAEICYAAIDKFLSGDWPESAVRTASSFRPH
jgi:proline iminopeptidase